MNNILFKILMLKGDAGEPTDEQTQSAVDDYMQTHPEAAIDETIINSAVDDWLGDHPEATTSILDGAITYPKLHSSMKAYVTPQMFGAAGDGVTDDTNAIKTCLQKGVPINLMGLPYVCNLTDAFSDVQIYNGTLISSHVIEISGNIDIDIELIADSSNGILLNNASGNIAIRTTQADASLLILENSNNVNININGTNIAGDAVLLNDNNHNINITVNIDGVGDSTHPAIYINSGATAALRNTCISVRDSVIKNCNYFGILASGEQILIENTIIDTCLNGGSCIWVHDASYATIRNVKASNANRNGIYVNKSNNVLIDNCEAYNNYFCGLMLAYDSNTTPYYSGVDAHNVANVIGCYFHGNNIATAYSDVRIDGWKNVTFVGCKVGTSRTVVVANEANENMSFINCRCEGTTYFAGNTDAIALCFGIVDVYDSNGHKSSFSGKNPVANTTYTLGTYTASRYLSYASSTTVETLTNVLATLIKDLKDRGLLN